MARRLMIQGTGSHVGKSVIVAALCRIFANEGYEVAPFKAQNMSLNSYVTADGLEIARSQVFQALAARKEPVVEMNPILLKPTSEKGAQVILKGKPVAHMTTQQYYEFQPKAVEVVKECFKRLDAENDIIIIEGAGSPAEVNLRENDIVNMFIAKEFNAPVILVGDIERGGVFAWLIGTLELLQKEERELVKGFIINKFRGDLSILKPGLDFLEAKTGKRVLGVVPFFHHIRIQEEDSLSVSEKWRKQKEEGGIDERNMLKIAVIRLPHISNLTDFDALSAEPDVSLRYVADVEALRDADVIILPGSKNTISDLLWLRERGLAAEIKRAASEGKFIFGICGGFQMLTARICDESGVESPLREVEGLALLNATTTFSSEKITHRVKARSNLPFYKGFVEGYEIHMGTSNLTAADAGNARHAFTILERSMERVCEKDGAFSPEGNVIGTYIHGIFDNDAFRDAFLNFVARRRKKQKQRKRAGRGINWDIEIEKLANFVKRHIDIEKIYKILFS